MFRKPAEQTILTKTLLPSECLQLHIYQCNKILFRQLLYLFSSDVTPPAVDSVALISSNQIDLYFTEALSLVSAANDRKLFREHGIAYAISAARDTSDFSLVHTKFGNYFTNGQTYTLTVTGVQDLSNNTDVNDIKTFVFFVPQANDVVINEIMADPDPVVGLPIMST